MYKLPKLSYLFQDLEPYIDIHTMGIHYYKHHQNYLNKLNDVLEKNKYDYRYSIEELVYHVDEFPIKDREDILFNLGGVINHNLYWLGINPKYKREPYGKFKDSLEKTFGSFNNFWMEMKNMALKIRGSGYTFLVLNKDGRLDIINVFNQDIPLLLGYIPLFNIDMWEHAYYLNYENDKVKYIDNFKEVVDFSYASEVYNRILK